MDPPVRNAGNPEPLPGQLPTLPQWPSNFAYWKDYAYIPTW